jgi:hypothetical protein
MTATISALAIMNMTPPSERGADRLLVRDLEERT